MLTAFTVVVASKQRNERANSEVCRLPLEGVLHNVIVTHLP